MPPAYRMRTTLSPVGISDDELGRRRAIGARLKLAREAAGYKEATQAAIRHGWKVPTYLGHENGSRGQKNAIPEYAAAFKVAPGWLAFGEEPWPDHIPRTRAAQADPEIEKGIRRVLVKAGQWPTETKVKRLLDYLNQYAEHNPGEADRIVDEITLKIADLLINKGR